MKNARNLLICLVVVFASQTTVNAQSITQLAPNYFVAGIPTAEFEYFAAPNIGGRQRQANWCWAATVQMVLNYHGLYVTQEQIVGKIFGTLVDQPGQPHQILAALSGWAPDLRGRFSAISASPFVFKGSEIVQDLAYKWPLIVGLRRSPIGHAYVLTAVYYQVDPYTQEPVFDKVVLRDPWPRSPSRQEMSWPEFADKLMFVARVRVHRL